MLRHHGCRKSNNNYHSASRDAYKTLLLNTNFQNARFLVQYTAITRTPLCYG